MYGPSELTGSLTERARVAQHIARAERAALDRDVSSLPALTRLVRSLLLRELARYRRAARFPINRDFAARTPYFVDAEGTRCAMAHLLELGGEHDLVARIARERNHAYVRDLADEARLLAWLAAAGLSVGEAAAIQPEYCATNAACVCGDSLSAASLPYPVPAIGVLEGVIVDLGGAGPAIVRIDQVHGDGVGWAPGDTIHTFHSRDAEVGARVLAPVDATSAGRGAHDAPLGSVLLHEDDTLTCVPWEGPASTLSRDLFLRAVRSSDCVGTLVADDPRWSRRDCDAEGGGCAASGLQSSAPTTLGILIAIVSVLAMRGRRERAKD
ncbi:hypothetical protein [Sandaracinus amylolyticus]|uniref:hypothetical protein n=1 Tax=Sandaracinus amylolyticus TaxID=927083 RepID=UPI001F46C479|nr:hypothetical protein [Sandaracinus amylolyticus]UJR87120.1 Hypothetical protein I5071_92210 [Sandaracinus amylolyticus]